MTHTNVIKTAAAKRMGEILSSLDVAQSPFVAGFLIKCARSELPDRALLAKIYTACRTHPAISYEFSRCGLDREKLAFIKLAIDPPKIPKPTGPKAPQPTPDLPSAASAASPTSKLPSWMTASPASQRQPIADMKPSYNHSMSGPGGKTPASISHEFRNKLQQYYNPGSSQWDTPTQDWGDEALKWGGRLGMGTGALAGGAVAAAKAPAVAGGAALAGKGLQTAGKLRALGKPAARAGGVGMAGYGGSEYVAQPIADQVTGTGAGAEGRPRYSLGAWQEQSKLPELQAQQQQAIDALSKLPPELQQQYQDAVAASDAEIDANMVDSPARNAAYQRERARIAGSLVNQHRQDPAAAPAATPADAAAAGAQAAAQQGAQKADSSVTQQAGQPWYDRWMEKTREAVSQAPEQAREAFNQVTEQAKSVFGTPEGAAVVDTVNKQGQLPPEAAAQAKGQLAEELGDPKAAEGLFSQMSPWEHAGLWGGLGLGAIGLINALGGQGGIGSWLMTLLGLGAAGFAGANSGLFGEDAQNKTQGLTKSVTQGGKDLMAKATGDPAVGDGELSPMVKKLLQGVLSLKGENADAGIGAALKLVPEHYPEAAAKLDQAAGTGSGRNAFMSFVGDITGKKQQAMQNKLGLSPEQSARLLELWGKHRS